MNTLQKIQANLVRSTLKAFTLLESLLTLFIVSFLALALSGSVHSVFRQVEEQVFFMEFEQLYKSSQKLAVSSQQTISLDVTPQQITNGYQSLYLPESVQVDNGQKIVFDKDGGNSSLAKLQFLTDQKIVRYQLYLGSGRYKKTEE
ncbi:competence type IV pilus minor pilin ComGD [Streptococcus marmotae]|uniref:competence type IV pilus minor pilin ComGD n=1 Tax=Streptococcus marmotae TaxID=1825069 RepID=UPI000833321F|nr:competence type IV pilus minor pilin ComGD [Streptococcus marmotae]